MHNQRLTKYFLAPLYMHKYITHSTCIHGKKALSHKWRNFFQLHEKSFSLLPVFTHTGTAGSQYSDLWPQFSDLWPQYSDLWSHPSILTCDPRILTYDSSILTCDPSILTCDASILTCDPSIDKMFTVLLIVNCIFSRVLTRTCY